MSLAFSLLLVEDEPATLEIYIAIFSRTFPQALIYTATNPEEAIALFEQHHPRIIITDYRVPNQHDGLRIADEICALDPTIVVFIVTADADLVAEIVKGREAGEHCIEAVYAKPLDFQDLIRHVREILSV